jgi:hypothetical protein
MALQNNESQTIFQIAISQDTVLEVRVSRASTPVIGPPPRPKRFEYVCELGANTQFVIRGGLDEATAAPLVSPPPKPK